VHGVLCGTEGGLFGCTRPGDALEAQAPRKDEGRILPRKDTRCGRDCPRTLCLEGCLSPYRLISNVSAGTWRLRVLRMMEPAPQPCCAPRRCSATEDASGWRAHTRVPRPALAANIVHAALAGGGRCLRCLLVDGQPGGGSCLDHGLSAGACIRIAGDRLSTPNELFSTTQHGGPVTAVRAALRLTSCDGFFW
jgi:hypothetical protein